MFHTMKRTKRMEAEVAKIKNELALRRDGIFKSVDENGVVRWYYREKVCKGVVRRVFLNEHA